MTEPMTTTPATDRPRAPRLTGEVHQTLHLAQGAREVHALVGVDAVGDLSGADGRAEDPEAAEVIVLDASSSMVHPPSTARAASEAAVAAIEAMRDDVWFAVLAGTDRVRSVWPPEGGMRRAGRRSRVEAADALRRQDVGGGTRIGAWLHAASALLADHPNAIRHTILLTDGHDEHETRTELDAAIAATRDTMTCDCRGVGDGWSFPELSAIASAMHGTTARVAEPSDLADDFRSMMTASMGKAVGEVALRVWTPLGGRVTVVTQTAPSEEDLSTRRRELDPQVGLYPTGAWGEERRDFQIAIDVPPADPGRTRLAARISFVRAFPDGTTEPLEQEYVRRLPSGSEERRDEALVSATWTIDPEVDTGRAEHVVRVETERRIAQQIREAMAALEDGRDERADELLRLAREWAAEIGQADLVRHIDEMFDPETDTFRARAITRAEQLDLEVESTRRPVQRVPER